VEPLSAQSSCGVVGGTELLPSEELRKSERKSQHHSFGVITEALVTFCQLVQTTDKTSKRSENYKLSNKKCITPGSSMLFS